MAKLSARTDCLYDKTLELKQAIDDTETMTMNRNAAEYFCRKIIPLMEQIRELADELEAGTASEYWPMPSYQQLLFT